MMLMEYYCAHIYSQKQSIKVWRLSFNSLILRLLCIASTVMFCSWSISYLMMWCRTYKYWQLLNNSFFHYVRHFWFLIKELLIVLIDECCWHEWSISTSVWKDSEKFSISLDYHSWRIISSVPLPCILMFFWVNAVGKNLILQLKNWHMMTLVITWTASTSTSRNRMTCTSAVIMVSIFSKHPNAPWYS